MRSTIAIVFLAMLLLLLQACASHQPPAASDVAVADSGMKQAAVKGAEEKTTGSGETSAKPRVVGEGETTVASRQQEAEGEAEGAKPPVPPQISLNQLVERLKQTDAIGFLTKLTIRSDVLEFKETVDTYRRNGGLSGHLESLRGHFDGLLLKIVALLDRDPALSKDIYSARESIWRSFLEEQL